MTTPYKELSLAFALKLADIEAGSIHSALPGWLQVVLEEVSWTGLWSEVISYSAVSSLAPGSREYCRLGPTDWLA